MVELEVGDTVLCTVQKIEGTTVFVNIEGNGEGSIIVSEIAPGRIRNLREYVVPKKTIVCKILRIRGDRVELSLRRVTPKERKEVIDEYKQERSYASVLKSVLGEKVTDTIEEIKKDNRLFDFLEEAKEDSSALEKLIGKEDAKKVLDIVKTQKEKKTVLKKEIRLKTTNPEGIKLIKEILGKVEDIEVSYISAGRYSLKTESDNPKKADNQIKEVIENIEKEAKKQGFDFSIKEK